MESAVWECSSRGLVLAAKWAAQQFGSGLVLSTSLSASYCLGKAHFDCKEYLAAAHVLSSDDPLSKFLHYYSLFLVAEGTNNHDGYVHIESELVSDYKTGKLDGFLLYLYGMVSLKLKQSSLGMDALVQSVTMYPWNWSAWTELSNTVNDVDSVSRLLPRLPEGLMTDFWKIHVGNELGQSLESVGAILDRVEAVCPCVFVQAQRAVLHHNVRDFDEAETCFEALAESHPFMLEYMDIYSNVLYVKEAQVNLCHLAHRASSIEKYRHETCVIMGNYYSLKQEREKAIGQFQRALKLNGRYAAALTLMGHEYVELRNPQAAIEVYRRAVDLNPRDYRAWFGLAQAYDLLRLPLYSLYYYERAVAIRPYDGRMWNALGSCFDVLDRSSDAIKCLKKALEGSDGVEPLVYVRLGKLYQKLGQNDNAASVYQKYLDECDPSDNVLSFYIRNTLTSASPF